MGKRIYIDNKDFLIDPPSKYYGLSPKRAIFLKYAGILEYQSHEVDENGKTTMVKGLFQKTWSKLPKGVITWISKSN